MPAFFLDTPEILPLPNLKVYTSLSVLLLSCSLWYAYQVTSEPDWKLNTSFGLTLSEDEHESAGDIFDLNENATIDTHYFLRNFLNQTNESILNFDVPEDSVVLKRLIDITFLMFNEPLCNWTLMNMACCCLTMVGKAIQQLVFGELRVSELQNLKCRFWNFVIYKFIFIFWVLNVQSMNEVVLWCSWFSLLGFLLLWAQLCRDRFEYLSFSPTTPKWTHLRLLSLLMVVFVSSVSLWLICVAVGFHCGLSIFAFMFAECLILSLRALYVLVRYVIHLWNVNYQGVWENRSSYTYYTELIFELAFQLIDFFHYLHMLIWGNIILSMASLFVLLQLRYFFNEIKRRIKKHKNYLQVIRLMDANYPMATADELEKNSDDCAICWDKMEMARKLPCNHLFHNSCLRSWLEQDTSCPTCRTSLKNRNEDQSQPETGAINTGGDTQSVVTSNRFFHFDGSQYASWLPSVSVAVHRPNSINIQVATTDRLERIDPNWSMQIDTMVNQVHELFPNIPMSNITADIRETRSVHLTIENILDGRVGNTVNNEATTPSQVYDNLSSLSSSSSNPVPSSSHLASSSSSTAYISPQPSSSSMTSSSSCACSSSSLTASANGPVINLRERKPFFVRNEGLNGEEDLSPVSSRQYSSSFSEKPDERKAMLDRRRDELFDAARRNYLARQRGTNATHQD